MPRDQTLFSVTQYFTCCASSPSLFFNPCISMIMFKQFHEEIIKSTLFWGHSHQWEGLTLGSVLDGFRGLYGMLGIEPKWPHPWQALYLLYFLSGP